MRKEETKEEDEVYTPYEHLRTVLEDSDFYALEYTVDVDRDILGKQSHVWLRNSHYSAIAVI